MKKHFVTFLSPGTFYSESTSKSIKKWDVKLALKMVPNIRERHGATPYGFYFSTRGRTKGELDSKRLKTSKTYYLGGVIETLAQVKARATKKDDTLLWNMEANNYKKIITNTNSYKITLPFDNKKDVLLKWTPEKTKEKI